MDLSVNPILVEVLGAQAPKAERKGPVWKLTGDEVKAAAKRLSRYGRTRKPRMGNSKQTQTR